MSIPTLERMWLLLHSGQPVPVEDEVAKLAAKVAAQLDGRPPMTERERRAWAERLAADIVDAGEDEV